MKPAISTFARAMGLEKVEKAGYAAASQNDVKAWLAKLLSPPRPVKPNTELMTEGQPSRHGVVLHEGWAACYRQLDDGRRQILKIAVAGDVLGFRGLFSRSFDRSAVTLTRARISLFPRDVALSVIQTHARIGAAFLSVSSFDEALIAEHLVNVGRRTALERTAHLFVELGERLKTIGLVEGGNFACPLTQDHLGRCAGPLGDPRQSRLASIAGAGIPDAQGPEDAAVAWLE